MRIFMGELRKVFFRRGFLAVLAALLLLDGFLICRNQTVSVLIPPQAYRQLYSDLYRMSDNQKLAYLQNGEQEMTVLASIEMDKQSGQTLSADPALLPYKNKLAYYTSLYEKGGYLKYTNYLFAESQLYSDTLREFNRVKGYAKYLGSIQDKADQMKQVSIFSNPNSFAYRNIEKTAKDLKALSGLSLTFDQSNGVNMATGFIGTDLFILLLLFYISVRLVMTEKEKGQLMLTRPTFRGRSPLICAKLFAVALTALVLETAFFAVNFGTAASLYGFGDLSRVIQSVQGFNGSSLKLNVLQYLVFFLLTKWVAYVVVGFLMLFLCIVAKNSATVYVTAAAVLGLEFALSAAISDFSPLLVFKYLNLISFIRVTTLSSDYLNLNLFGYPVNLLPAAAVTVVLLFVLLFAASVVTFTRQEGVVGENALSRLLSHLHLPRSGESVRVRRHEWFKLLVSNRALLVLLALLAIQIYSYQHYQAYLDADEIYYRGYMQKLSGELTPQKVDFLNQEQKKFDDLNAAMTKLSEEYRSGKLSEVDYNTAVFALSGPLKPQRAFNQVMEQYHRIQNAPPGEHLAFVYDGGYNIIFGVGANTGDLMNALKLVIVLTGLFAAVFSFEYSGGAVHLISTTLKGREHTFRVKTALCLLLTLPVFAVCYAPDLINICRNYGLDQLHAPVASLPAFAALSSHLSLMGYLLLLYALRLFAAVICVLLILFLSQLLRSTFAAMLVAIGILAGPVILSLLGFSLLDPFSLNAILLGNPLFLEKFAVSVLQVAVPMLLGAAALTVIRLQFCRPHRPHAAA